jgi:hypothetical protein
MTLVNKLKVALCAGALFAVPFAFPQSTLAQDHIVSSTDLRTDIANAAQARQQHIATIEKLLSSDQGQQALKSANIDYKVIQNGISTLSDDELARLSSQAEQAQKSFAAGALSNQDITYILIALATAVIVLILVH